MGLGTKALDGRFNLKKTAEHATVHHIRHRNRYDSISSISRCHPTGAAAVLGRALALGTWPGKAGLRFAAGRFATKRAWARGRSPAEIGTRRKPVTGGPRMVRRAFAGRWSVRRPAAGSMIPRHKIGSRAHPKRLPRSKNCGHLPLGAAGHLVSPNPPGSALRYEPGPGGRLRTNGCRS